MVLYYGLFALQTANNSITSHRRTTPMIRSENSWIYTEDLKKRYHHQYILIPIYIDKKTARKYYSSPVIFPWNFEERKDSWIDYRLIANLFRKNDQVISRRWEILCFVVYKNWIVGYFRSMIDYEPLTNWKKRLTRLQSLFEIIKSIH